MGSNIRFTFNDINNLIQSWLDWQDAKSWARKRHPAWVQLATQYKRPEIRETYRNKILDEYSKVHWILK